MCIGVVGESLPILSPVNGMKSYLPESLSFCLGDWDLSLAACTLGPAEGWWLQGPLPKQHQMRGHRPKLTLGV